MSYEIIWILSDLDSILAKVYYRRLRHLSEVSRADVILIESDQESLACLLSSSPSSESDSLVGSISREISLLVWIIQH